MNNDEQILSIRRLAEEWMDKADNISDHRHLWEGDCIELCRRWAEAYTLREFARELVKRIDEVTA